MYVQNQSFLVLGVSKSGFSASKYILGRGGKCFIYEQLQSDKITNAINELVELGAILVKAENMDSVVDQIDVLVISPGVPINHEIAVKCKEKGKRIMGEAEFGFLCLTPTVVGVTGTNGKTTTVNLIDYILKKTDRKSFLVGNVGVPISEKVREIDKDSVCIAEISSFQLESMSEFKPHIACVLNISPDHLERHYTMENYVFLKKRILKNLKESEYAVLNYDDSIIKEFAKETRAKIVWVSLTEKTQGVYIENDKIFFNGECVTDVSNVNLFGEHNVFNGLVAIAVSKLLGVSNETITLGVKEFKGVPHRIELVEDKNGVKYYNDSKATNTASTITAIKSMNRPTVLILGGSEKGEKYFELFTCIKNSLVKHVVITGASRYNMLETAGKVGVTDITLTADFVTAVKIANVFAVDGDAVLLSPACASFDSFTDYEERGRVFTETVKQCN